MSTDLVLCCLFWVSDDNFVWILHKIQRAKSETEAIADTVLESIPLFSEIDGFVKLAAGITPRNFTRFQCRSDGKLIWRMCLETLRTSIDTDLGK